MIDEGYIKFDCQWTESPPLPATQIDCLNQWRSHLYDRHLIGAYPDGIGFGNISQRYESLRFIISGSATGNLPQLDERHYSLVTAFDLDLNRVECQGPIKASSESMSHAVIYQQLPNVQAVFHIHSLAMWTHFIDKLPTTDPSATYGTPEMATEIIRLLNESQLARHEKCFVMGGHREGIIAFGDSLDEAGANLLRYYDQLPNK
ncbi:MAG: class II aldolase/adducin family protein [Bacteroidota bacterium]